MFILKPSDKQDFIDRLVDEDINRAVAEMLSTYTTQLETAIDLK